jgi:hypothetical protein
MAIEFVSPGGANIEHPEANAIHALITACDPNYWSAGDAEGGVYWRDMSRAVCASLTLLFHPEFGFCVTYYSREGEHACLVDGARAATPHSVSMMRQGLWSDVSLALFVSAEQAAAVTHEFIVHNTGARPAGVWAARGGAAVH